MHLKVLCNKYGISCSSLTKVHKTDETIVHRNSHTPCKAKTFFRESVNFLLSSFASLCFKKQIRPAVHVKVNKCPSEFIGKKILDQRLFAIWVEKIFEILRHYLIVFRQRNNPSVVILDFVDRDHQIANQHM